MPDLYQGGELWDHSLVDPDNRRPVDYELRRKLLKEMRSAGIEAGVAQRGSGATHPAQVGSVDQLLADEERVRRAVGQVVVFQTAIQKE